MKTDDELIESYGSGDERAFAELLDRYLDTVYAFALRLVGSRDDAEDIAQETFLKAWKSLARFRKGANFKTWLLAIARNTAIDRLRKKRHLLFTELTREDDDDFEHSVRDDTPLAPVLYDERLAAETLEEAVGKLPPHYREIVILRYREGLTLEESAHVLKVPLNTAKSRDRRAQIALRKLIEPGKGGTTYT